MLLLYSQIQELYFCKVGEESTREDNSSCSWLPPAPSAPEAQWEALGQHEGDLDDRGWELFPIAYTLQQSKSVFHYTN